LVTKVRSPSQIKSRNFQSATVSQALQTPTQKKALAIPMQRPFALSFTVGAILYAAVSVLTLIVFHDATSNRQALNRPALNSGYGISTSGQ
jgi:hypothetical protein